MALEHRDCAEIDEMLPAYAVHALDDSGRARVEVHLASCDRHEDAAAWGDVALRLADLVPAMTPPADLRDRVMAITSAPAEPAAPPEVAPVEEAPVPVEVLPAAVEEPTAQATGVPRARLPYALAAAFATIAVIFAAWTAVFLAGGDEPAASLTTSASAGGVAARASFIADERVAVLRFDGLEGPPAGSVYQLWAIGPDVDPTPAGLLLTIEDGHAVAAVEGDFGPGWTFTVTAEPDGGSPAPTTDPLVSLTF